MRSWWPSLVLGGIIAAFLFFWLGAVTVTRDRVDAPHGIIDYWLYRYQTVLAGSFAIGGAAIGAFAVLRQIRHAGELAAQDRHRRMQGARAMMPLALSHLIDYADEAARCLDGLRNQCVGHVLPTPTPVPPVPVDFPDSSLAVLRDAIEHGDKDLSDSVSLLLARLQVHRSRVFEVIEQANGNGRIGRTIFDLNLESYLIDSAEIYARAAALFDYARRLAETTENIGSANMESALNLLGFDEFTDPQMYQRIRARASWDIVPT